MKTSIEWRKHPEMVEFMMNFIPGHEEHEIRSEFLNKFGIELSEGQIGNFKHRYHIKSGTNGGRFKKGQKAHNKGKKVSSETYKRIAPTMFKKGIIPHNHKEIGSTRTDTDGYVMIKIAEPNKWQLMQCYIWEDENGRKGILEIKTSNILQSMQKEKWNHRIPDNYYLQVLHYLMVTGFDFAVLKAQLKSEFAGDVVLSTKHYFIERADVEEDIEILKNAEKTFYEMIQKNIKPNLILPNLI